MAKPDAKAIVQIALVMHETVRAWQKANGQSLAPPWGRAPKWMKDASIASVKWRVENPNAPISAQHDQWMSQKTAEGWKYAYTHNLTSEPADGRSIQVQSTASGPSGPDQDTSSHVHTPMK